MHGSMDPLNIIPIHIPKASMLTREQRSMPNISTPIRPFTHRDRYGSDILYENRRVPIDQTIKPSDCHLNQNEQQPPPNTELSPRKFLRYSNQDLCVPSSRLRTSEGSDLALAWNNLTFYKSSMFSSAKTPILCQLKGQVNFGTMTALMGPSGAGKTTLLKCMNGANMQGLSATTEIFVSKYELMKACYIKQNVVEHLWMGLTARESLMYSSLLKNRPIDKNEHLDSEFVKSNGNFDHYANVKKLLNDLMLNDCADTLIKLCSGGEQKRLVIAQELSPVEKPNLMCIDEPTSGLDSNAAEQTMLCLSSLAKEHNLAIVTSIHQPNADVLLIFNQLYILAKGGRCVYAGPPTELKAHLRECHIPCADWQVPIEVLLKTASLKKKEMLAEFNIEAIDFGPPDDIVNLMTKTYKSQFSIEKISKMHGVLCTGGFSEHQRNFHPLDLFYLLKRCLLISWIREWKVTYGIVLLNLLLGGYLLVLYREDIGEDAACLPKNIIFVSKIDKNMNNFSNGSMSLESDGSNVSSPALPKFDFTKQSLAEQNLSFLFVNQVMLFFLHLSLMALTFPKDVKIFFNEHSNRWYSTSCFYFAKCITELPIVLIYAYLYLWIGYYATSQPGMKEWYNGVWDMSERFSLFLLYILLGLFCTQGMSIFIGIVCSSSFQLASVVSIGAFLLQMFFNAFLVPIYELGKFFELISWASFPRLTLESTLMIIFGRGRCPDGQKSIVLSKMHVKEHDFWNYLYAIIVILVVWRVLGLIALIIKANPDVWWKLKMCNKNRKQKKQLLGSRLANRATRSKGEDNHGYISYNDSIFS